MESPRAYPAGLRHFLRSETSAAHAQLDTALSRLDLRTLDGYRRFLEINAAALLPLEAALGAAHVERVVPDWHLRARRHAILQDLTALYGKITPLPVALDLTPDRMLGVTYVLEGSRLGARFLLGMVQASPDPRVAQATAYLSHGASDRLWQSFLAILERADNDADYAEAAEGARQTFDLFAKAAAS